MARPVIRLDWLLAAGLAAAALASGPAYADSAPVVQYPGESHEEFVARAHLAQEQKLAAADQAAGMFGAGGFGSSASSGGGLGAAGGLMSFGGIGLLMLVMWGIRMSMMVNRTAKTFTRASGLDRGGDSFEDRLAERLREIEAPGVRTAPLPGEFAPKAVVPEAFDPVAATPGPVAAAPAIPAPVARPAPGVRTFGRRVS